MSRGKCLNKDDLHLAFGIFYLCLSPIATVTNSFMLYVARRDPHRQFNKPTNVFNLGIARIYVFTALIVLPFIGIDSILQSQHLSPEGINAAKLFQDFLVCFVISSGCVIYLVISIERSTAVVFPVWNRKHVTVRRARILNTTITGICLLFSCILLTGIAPKYFYFAFIPIFVWLPCLGLLILPAVGLYALKRQARKIVATMQTECLTCEAYNQKEKARRNAQIRRYLLESLRVTITSIIILGFFTVVKILEMTRLELSCDELLEHLSYTILFVPVTLNPIILLKKIPAYWKAAKHIWNRR